MANQCAQYIGVFGQIVLRQRCHHAVGIRHRNINLNNITRLKLTLHPLILDETCSSGINDHVHAEASCVEIALRLQLSQVRKC